MMYCVECQRNVEPKAKKSSLGGALLLVILGVLFTIGSPVIGFLVGSISVVFGIGVLFLVVGVLAFFVGLVQAVAHAGSHGTCPICGCAEFEDAHMVSAKEQVVSR